MSRFAGIVERIEITDGGVTTIDGISGAVTLVAGTGITIADNTPSAGDITISSTGSGGTPGGSQYDIQTNNGSGGFYGDGNFTWNPSTQVMEVIAAGGGKVYLSDPAKGGEVASTDSVGNSGNLATGTGGGEFSDSTGNYNAYLSGNTANGAIYNGSQFTDALNNVIISDGTHAIYVTYGVVNVQGLNVSSALIADSSKNIASSSTSSTELGYVHGVTSAIQTQLNAKGTGSVTSITCGTGLTGGTITTTGTIALAAALPNGTTATTQSALDSSTKVATTAYTDAAVTAALNGLDWKPAVGYATTANVIGTNVAGVFTYTSTGVDTIDGHQLALNDVVLFKNQTTGADNGVWVVTTAGAIGVAGVLTRRSDYNTAADIHDGDTFFVQNGTTNAATAWVQTDTVNTINSDPLAFSQVSGPGTYVAGTGLTLTGNSFSVNASQTQITALGTIGTGVWQGTLVGATYGGTGVNNGSSTITLGGSMTLSGAYTFTGTLTNTTSVTFPTSGTLAVLGANSFTGLQTLSPASGIAGYVTAGSWEEAVYSNGNSGTSKAINLDNGNLQSVTITGAVTMTMTTPTYPGKWSLIVTQDGSGHTYSFSGVKWVGGSQPTWSTAANAIDVVSFIYDGTNFYGTGGVAFA